VEEVPLFEYECSKCGHRFEKIHKFADRSIKTCPKCGGKVARLPSAPAIQFKGTGWYITDYARKGQTGGDDKSSKSGDEKASKPSEDKPTKVEKSSKEERSSREEKSSKEQKGSKVVKKKGSDD
jgi:putative FmdB family regulatory protein